MKKAIETISTETMEALTRYDWPGNIRELQNLIERAVILSSGQTLDVPIGALGPRQTPAATREAGETSKRPIAVTSSPRSNAATGCSPARTGPPRGWGSSDPRCAVPHAQARDRQAAAALTRHAGRAGPGFAPAADSLPAPALSGRLRHTPYRFRLSWIDLITEARCAGHTEPVPPSQRLGRRYRRISKPCCCSASGSTPKSRPSSARALRDALRRCSGVRPWTSDEAGSGGRRSERPAGRIRTRFRVRTEP